MRYIILFFSLVGFSSLSAQTQWFISPEVGTIFHGDHLGRTMGFQMGLTFLNGRLKTGFTFYGRSGPINPQTFQLDLPAGTDYKGQTTLHLRGDHGAFAVFVAPVISLPSDWQLEIPVAFGQLGGGFYLVGEDRITPDGRRVSEWEDDLMGGTDAGFGWLVEGGLRVSRSVGQHVRIGGGLHYSQTIGYQSFVGGSDFYNRPRAVLYVEFGN